jgi:hypothetical protein
MLIAFSGKIGVGKDTAAKIVQNHFPQFRTVKFAANLKKRLCITWGVSMEQLENREFKNSIHPQLGITWRKLMELEGEKMREIDIEYWNKSLMANYVADKNGNYPNWIISDLRYPNELEFIKEYALIIRLERFSTESSDHHSNTALDDYPFTYKIDNNGTLEELEDRILTIIKESKIEIPKSYHSGKRSTMTMHHQPLLRIDPKNAYFSLNKMAARVMDCSEGTALLFVPNGDSIIVSKDLDKNPFSYTLNYTIILRFGSRELCDLFFEVYPTMNLDKASHFLISEIAEGKFQLSKID